MNYEVARDTCLQQNYASIESPVRFIEELLDRHIKQSSIELSYQTEELRGCLALAYAAEGRWDDFLLEVEKVSSTSYGLVTHLLLNAFSIARNPKKYSEDGIKLVTTKSIKHLQSLSFINESAGLLEHEILRHVNKLGAERFSEDVQRIETSARERTLNHLERLQKFLSPESNPIEGEEDDFIDYLPLPSRLSILLKETLEYSKILKNVDPVGWIEFSDSLSKSICAIKKIWDENISELKSSCDKDELLDANSELLLESIELFDVLCEIARYQFISSSEADNSFQTLKILSELIPSDFHDDCYGIAELMKVRGEMDALLFVIEKTTPADNKLQYEAEELLEENRTRIDILMSLTSNIEPIDGIRACRSYLSGWFDVMNEIGGELPGHISAEPMKRVTIPHSSTVDIFDDLISEVATEEAINARDYSMIEEIARGHYLMANILEFNPLLGDSQLHRDEAIRLSIIVVSEVGVSFVDLDEYGAMSIIIDEIKRLHDNGSMLGKYALVKTTEEILLKQSLSAALFEQLFVTEDSKGVDDVDVTNEQNAKMMLMVLSAQIGVYDEAILLYQDLITRTEGINDRFIHLVNLLTSLSVPELIET